VKKEKLGNWWDFTVPLERITFIRINKKEKFNGNLKGKKCVDE
jgi:hypothetical protein